FRHVVLNLQTRCEHGLFAFEEFGPALYFGDRKSASAADVLFAFAQGFGSECSLLLSCFSLELRHQNAEIKRMGFQSNLMFRAFEVVFGGCGFSRSSAVRLTDAQQLGQWLGNHGAARKESLLALRQVDVSPGNERA